MWFFFFLCDGWLLPALAAARAGAWAAWLVFAGIVCVVTFAGLVVAMFWRIFGRSMVPHELHLLPMANTVLRRKVPFLGRSSEVAVTSAQVDSVEVLAKRLNWHWRGLVIRVRMKSGSSWKVDSGVEEEALWSLACDLSQAFGTPVVEM